MVFLLVNHIIASHSVCCLYIQSTTVCDLLLDEFVTACDPNKKDRSCTKKNDQMYQLSVDQICDAVNTDIKLSTAAINKKMDNSEMLYV